MVIIDAPGKMILGIDMEYWKFWLEFLGTFATIALTILVVKMQKKTQSREEWQHNNQKLDVIKSLSSRTKGRLEELDYHFTSSFHDISFKLQRIENSFDSVVVKTLSEDLRGYYGKTFEIEIELKILNKEMKTLMMNNSLIESLDTILDLLNSMRWHYNEIEIGTYNLHNEQQREEVVSEMIMLVDEATTIYPEVIRRMSQLSLDFI